MDRLSTQIDWQENLKVVLQRKAAKRVRSERENFCAIDVCGSNFDDCFDMGIEDGEILYARELLELYF